jgi:hypothetical protein
MFMIISHWTLLRMRNVWDKSCLEKFNTHIVCSIIFFQKLYSLWDNVEKYGRARQATNGNVTWHMGFACCINKATDTHSECVILIVFHGNNDFANLPQCYLAWLVNN